MVDNEEIRVDIGREQAESTARQAKRSMPPRRSFADREAYWASIDEERQKYFHFFEVVDSVQEGAMMKVKVGVAGDSPAQDSFPMFRSSKLWTVIYWNLQVPQDRWSLVFFEEQLDLEDSTRLSQAQINRAVRVLPLHEISEVYLDPRAVTAFRVYREREATQCSPTSPMVLASAWADAVYCVLQLQAFPSLPLLREYFEDYRTVMRELIAEETSKNEGLAMSRPPSLHPQSSVLLGLQAQIKASDAHTAESKAEDPVSADNAEENGDDDANNNKSTDENNKIKTNEDENGSKSNDQKDNNNNNQSGKVNKKAKGKRSSIMDSMRSTFFSPSSSASPSPSAPHTHNYFSSSGAEDDAQQQQQREGKTAKSARQRRWTTIGASAEDSSSLPSSPLSSPSSAALSAMRKKTQRQRVAHRQSLLPFASLGVLPSERGVGIKLAMEEERERERSSVFSRESIRAEIEREREREKDKNRDSFSEKERARVAEGEQERDSDKEIDAYRESVSRSRSRSRSESITNANFLSQSLLSSNAGLGSLRKSISGGAQDDLFSPARTRSVSEEVSLPHTRHRSHSREKNNDSKRDTERDSSGGNDLMLKTTRQETENERDRDRDRAKEGEVELFQSTKSVRWQEEREAVHKKERSHSDRAKNAKGPTKGANEKSEKQSPSHSSIARISEAWKNDTEETERRRQEKERERELEREKARERAREREKQRAAEETKTPAQELGRVTVLDTLFAQMHSLRRSTSRETLDTHDKERETQDELWSAIQRVLRKDGEYETKYDDDDDDSNSYQELNKELNEQQKSSSEKKAAPKDKVSPLLSVAATLREKLEFSNAMMLSLLRKNAAFAANHRPTRSPSPEKKKQPAKDMRSRKAKSVSPVRERKREKKRQTSPSKSQSRKEEKVPLKSILKKSGDASQSLPVSKPTERKTEEKKKSSSSANLWSSLRGSHATSVSVVNSTVAEGEQGRERALFEFLASRCTLDGEQRAEKNRINLKKQERIHVSIRPKSAIKSPSSVLFSPPSSSSSLSSLRSPMSERVTVNKDPVEENSRNQFIDTGDVESKNVLRDSFADSFADLDLNAMEGKMTIDELCTSPPSPSPSLSPTLSGPLTPALLLVNTRSGSPHKLQRLFDEASMRSVHVDHGENPNEEKRFREIQRIHRRESVRQELQKQSQEKNEKDGSEAKDEASVIAANEEQEENTSVQEENKFGLEFVERTRLAVIYEGKFPVTLSILSKECLREKLLKCKFTSDEDISATETKDALKESLLQKDWPVSSPPATQESFAYVTSRVGVQYHESILLENIPQARQLAILTLSAIIAELLDSEYYVQFDHYNEHDNKHEFVFVPIQGIVAIDIDSRGTGLFRFSMDISSADFPILHTKHVHGCTVFSNFTQSSLYSSPVSLSGGNIAECVLQLSNADQQQISLLRTWLYKIVDLRDNSQLGESQCWL